MSEFSTDRPYFGSLVRTFKVESTDIFVATEGGEKNSEGGYADLGFWEGEGVMPNRPRTPHIILGICPLLLST